MKRGSMRVRPVLVVGCAAALALAAYVVLRYVPAMEDVRVGTESIEQDEEALKKQLEHAQTEIARLTPLVEALSAQHPPASDAAGAAKSPEPAAIASSELVAWAREAGLEVVSLTFSAPASAAAPSEDPEDASAARPAAGAAIVLVADGKFPAVRALVKRVGGAPVTRLDLDRRTDGQPGVRMTLGISP